MAISNAFRPIYNEFCARETVIRSNAPEELFPFEVTGNMVSFQFIMTTFDNGEIDAAQAWVRVAYDGWNAPESRHSPDIVVSDCL